MTIQNIHTVTATLPPRMLIHGQEGTGKTTLAAQFPKPVFLQTEDGTPSGLTLNSFGLLEAYPAIRAALTTLANEPHDYETVVIDALDELEGLIWADVCKTRNWASIEAPGYGKGYVDSDLWWRDLLAALEYLRRQRGMVVLLLAHSAIETINDPRAASYTSYQLRLHKRARGLVQDWCDCIGFLAPDLVIKTEDAGFSKTRHRADGGSTRWLHVEGRPSFVAKNRYGLPPKIMIPKPFDFDATLAPHFPPLAARRTAASSNTNQEHTK
jgi:AAA domain